MIFKTITINIPDEKYEIMKLFVRKGLIKSKSQFAREAITNFLKEEDFKESLHKKVNKMLNKLDDI